MRAHFGLPSVSNEEDKKDRPPITVKFEIPYFTVSGIQVIIRNQNHNHNHTNHKSRSRTSPSRASRSSSEIRIIIRDLKIIEKSDLLRTYFELTPNLLF